MQIGGINANEIVTSLMELERIPLNALEARRTAAQETARAIGAMRSTVEAFRLTSLRLSDTTSFERYASNVSNPDAVAASVGPDATPGSLSFSVDQLASTHGLRTSGTVAASNLPITTDAFLSVAIGTKALGIGTVRAGAGLGAGKVDLSVTQASEAASAVGTTPLAASTDITALNNTLDLSVNGTAYNLTLTAGTYDAEALATEVSTQLQNAGAAATASLDSGGNLVIETAREGSAASIQVTGGLARTDLGLALDATANTGTDAIIDVDGTTTVVTSVESGATAAVDTGSGTLDITLSGGLRVGDTSVTTVDTGSGSLTDVAAAINGAGAGVSAAAVRVETGSWLLQLGSTTSGTAGELAVDGAAFAEADGLVETSAARNAIISIGDGAGAYTVEGAGNTFNDVMSGVTLNVSEVTTSPVNVRVARDDNALISDVEKMVTAANTLLAELKVQTRYDVANGTKGALANNPAIRGLADQVRAALGGVVDGVTGMLPTDVGIESTRDGTFTFDRTKLQTALTERPDEVARYFGRGATTPVGVTFDEATPETVTGSYDIEVTTAATRAASAQLFAGGPLADTRIGVRIGDVTATYDVTVGQSADQIVDGLNAAIAAAGLDLVAEIDGTGMRVRADDWGTAGSFELNTDVSGAGTWDPLDGVDVAGTIDGVLAVGVGRELSLLATADSNAAGLSVTIDGGLTGVLGSVVYQPGIAGRVAEFGASVTDDDTGLLETAEDSANRRIEDFNDQIDRFEDRLFIRETNMRRQWANLQTVLQGLQNQGDWISSQLASLPQINNN